MSGSNSEFVVGIDLGTTHCAMAEARLAQPSVRLLPIPQLVAPGEVGERLLLPSFMLLGASLDLPEPQRALPWGVPEHVVGSLALQLGVKSPGRLVASAKSWICHGGVNRRAPILPWNAPAGAPQVSPYAAQVAYLGHLRAVWEQSHRGRSLAEQDVVVTVPASFDETARDLTAAAAEEAGLGSVRLLEEPQAAFYDFHGEHADDLAAVLGDAKLILVVDVGGGTTDLTLLRVEGQAIERIAVGGHLMLGGDNMDAALAVFALQKAGLPRPEDATVWAGLVQSARLAKERLLGSADVTEAALTLAARGSRLIAGSRSIAITRDEAHEVLLEGFLPHSGPAEVAQRSARAGLTTLGLPYTTDTAIGRHICTFLRRHVEAASHSGAEIVDGLPRPDLLLLNGGVFNAPALVHRLSEVFSRWFGAPVPMLEHTSLDTAVARGAVRYGLARRGVGEVIAGGTARAYYIGIEGPSGQREALCVAPKGMEEGSVSEVPDRVFDLLLDRPVAFPLFAFAGDRTDAPGALWTLDPEHPEAGELEPLPWLETVVRFKGDAHDGGETVPVTLRASLTEVGALELYLVTVSLPPHRWKLEFSLHPVASAPGGEPPAVDASAETVTEAAALPAELDRAQAILREGLAGDPKTVKDLRRDLEKLLGPRGLWSGALCRRLWDTLGELREGRKRSENHELNWLRLCGWCLRPGFGAEGDAARIETMQRVLEEGLVHRSKANWAEWWIVWRRIAPGLDAAPQRALYEAVRPYLWQDVPKPPGPHAHGPVEMMQMLATLERLSAPAKQACGELFFERAAKIGSYWPVGRAGARVPFHGDPADIIPADVASAWLRRLLELDWAQAEGAAFAATWIARRSGDAARDIPEDERQEIVRRLQRVQASAGWIAMVERGSELSEGDAKRLLGDSLPVGLRLST